MARPGAVHHAADVAVQLDVVQVVLRGFDFQRIFFGDVAQFAEISVAEQRVVVEIDLGIEREQAAIGGGDERIDLHQRSVGVLESLVQAGHELHGLIDLLRLQAELERHLARLKCFQAHARIDVFLEMACGILRGDLLDFHAARGRRHKHRLAFRAIDHDAQIKFVLDGQRLFDQQPAHDAAFRPGLVRDQRHAEHLAGQLAGLFHRLGDLHAAAFAAAAGVDLRFHHHAGGAASNKLLRGRFGFFARCRPSRRAARRRHTSSGLLWPGTHEFS